MKGISTTTITSSVTVHEQIDAMKDSPALVAKALEEITLSDNPTLAAEAAGHLQKLQAGGTPHFALRFMRKHAHWIAERGGFDG